MLEGEDKKNVIRVRGIIINEGKLLVVKHRNNTSFCALPGGHLKWKEDIKKCLQREIIEELGVNPTIGRLLYINNFLDKNENQSIEFFFEITNGNDYKNHENIEKTHAHEISEICWLSTTDTTPLLPKSLWEDFQKGKIIADEVRYITN